MTKKKTPRDRITLQQREEALVITIKAKREIGTSLFLGGWLICWAFGWMAAFAALFLVPLASITIFLFVWLVFWTVGGFFAVSAFAWITTGKEEISISDERLSIWRGVTGSGNLFSMPMSKLNNMRAINRPQTGQEKGSRDWRKADAGMILIDHGKLQLGFGVDLEPREAQKLLDTIVAIFPRLRDV